MPPTLKLCSIRHVVSFPIKRMLNSGVNVIEFNFLSLRNAFNKMICASKVLSCSHNFDLKLVHPGKTNNFN